MTAKTETGPKETREPAELITHELTESCRYYNPLKKNGHDINKINTARQTLTTLGLPQPEELEALNGLPRILYEDRRFDVHLVNDVLTGCGVNPYKNKRETDFQEGVVSFLLQHKELVHQMHVHWQQGVRDTGVLTTQTFFADNDSIDTQLHRYLDTPVGIDKVDVYDFRGRYARRNQSLKKRVESGGTLIDFGSCSLAFISDVHEHFEWCVAVDRIVPHEASVALINSYPPASGRTPYEFYNMIRGGAPDSLFYRTDKQKLKLILGNVCDGRIIEEAVDPERFLARQGKDTKSYDYLDLYNPKPVVVANLNTIFPHYTEEKIIEWISKILGHSKRRKVDYLLIGGGLRMEYMYPALDNPHKYVRGWHTWLYDLRGVSPKLIDHVVDGQL